MKTAGNIRLLKSINTSVESIIELNIFPGEKTPWHYHSLFSETFKVLSGTLELGKGKKITQLKTGDGVTIKAYEKHYYHNISGDECTVTTTIDPGNKNFENALLVLKGLSIDGLSTKELSQYLIY